MADAPQIPDEATVRAEWGGFQWTPENAAQAEKVIARYPAGRQHSAVMPLLDLAHQGVGPARPRRRGLPDRLKWSFMPKESDGRPSAIWSSTPTSPSPAPARTARSCATIRTLLIEGALIAGFAMGAHACLHLHPRRVSSASARRCRRRSTRPMTRADRQERRGRAGTSTSTCTTAPAPISAARKPRCWKASRARRASRA
jgi:hypothetical protein